MQTLVINMKLNNTFHWVKLHSDIVIKRQEEK